MTEEEKQPTDDEEQDQKLPDPDAAQELEDPKNEEAPADDPRA
jgi:hypothetical protein